jgi:hypothetical protein
MYDDVFIAPTNRFNHRAAQTSINDIDHLPLGSETANTRPVFNDDVLDTTSNAPFIADSTARNSQNNKEELKLLPRSLVGKKSNNDGSTVSDLSAMRNKILLLIRLLWIMN